MTRLLMAILYGVFFAALAIGVRAAFDLDDLILVGYWAGVAASTGFWTAKALW